MNINFYNDQYFDNILRYVEIALRAGNVNELPIETPQLLFQLRSYILSHNIQIGDNWVDISNLILFTIKTVFALKLRVLRQFENPNEIDTYLYSIAKPMVEVLADEDLIQDAVDYNEDVKFYLKNFINTSISENFNDGRLLITDNEFEIQLGLLWTGLDDYIETVYVPQIYEDIEYIDYEPEFQY